MPRDPTKPMEDKQAERERADAQRRVAQGEAPWQTHEGVMAAVAAVRDVKFPATADEIVKKAGERDITASARLVVPIAEILAHMPERRFESIADFQTALQKHWQAIRFLEVPEEQRSPRGGFQPTQARDWPHHGGRAPQGLAHTRDGEP